MVTEALKGRLSTVGNRASSVRAEAGLTARPTGRAGAKAGHSDPVVPHGRAIAQRIKGTPGITGLSPPSVHSDGEVWHLDVGSSHPGAVANLPALPAGNRRVIIEPKTEKAMRTVVLQSIERMVHPVGKTIPEVQRAYLAGFIDGDGAIMALLERHQGKRF